MKTAAPRIAMVTGATQGLGLALVHGLSARLDPDDVVYLTSHDPARVAAAADAISGQARVIGRALDVRDGAAIASFAAELRREHGGVDLVLSNATGRGSPDLTAAAQIDAQVEISNHATSSVLRHLLPIVRPHGACIVVASSLGQLRHLRSPSANASSAPPRSMTSTARSNDGDARSTRAPPRPRDGQAG